MALASVRLSTRTDRLIAAIVEALERRRPSLDADECTAVVTVSVHLNDGGFVKTVEVERRERDSLHSFVRRA